MTDHVEPGPVLRTAVAADLPELRRVYRAASLSNVDDAPLLLARPEFLVFAGDGISAGRTLVAVSGDDTGDHLVGFASVVAAPDGELELEDLFVDPDQHRRGIARRLLGRVADTARENGYRRLWVTGNPHALDFYRAVGFVPTGEVATALKPAPRLVLELTGDGGGPTHPPRPAV